MSEIIFKCPFCGSGTKPTMVERKRVASKCEKCNLIHFYNYSDSRTEWFFEHTEHPKETGKGGKK